MSDPSTPKTKLPVPYAGPERRANMRIWREKVDRRLDDGSATMRHLRAELEENTKATKQMQSDTSELVSLLQSFKGAFKVFDLVGRAAKPLSYIAMACSALWGLIAVVKGGGAPK